MKMKDTWNGTTSPTPFVFCEQYTLQTKRFVLKQLQICFSNIKHKGKTLTASTVNKSLPGEREQKAGGG